MALSAVAGAAKTIGLALATEVQYLLRVEDQIRSLQRDLLCMHQFLQDVDANPYLLKQDGQLRLLSQEMQELAFRAEDAMDTYLVDVRSKIHKKNFFKKIVGLASHSYPVHMLMKEIEAIQQEIKAAIARSGDFRASISSTSQLQGDSSRSSYSKPVAENYIDLPNEFVVGIGDEIARLVNRLTDPQDDFQVLGIVGIGGGGKSTLASQIYRHAKVKSSFSYTAFVSISQKWSRLDLLSRIYKEIFGQSNISSTERELVTSLYKFMKDKRCLVVLDDIWKKQAWDDISHIFPRTHGIRVILTTRIEEVPLHADNKCVIHEPQVLTNDQMWELFSKIAVERRHGIENDAEFENLVKLMLQKCRGLPLAVVTLAGILKTKKKLSEWKQVSVALSSKILEGKGGSTYGVVEEMLELSYLELPAHLKPLFLYLAMMREDYEFPSNVLMVLWIAEGFVADDQTRCETLEDKAMQYMNELAQRYIIHVKEEYGSEFISLHDLMREFGIKKASECQFLEHVCSTRPCEKRPNKPRRVSIFSSGRGEYCLEENSYLRTILYQGSSNRDGAINKLESIHQDFKLLRVLSISDCANTILSKKIGNLINLTYLSLVFTEITELPESVRNLRNLTFFIFETLACRTIKMPDDLVGNMKNLRKLVLFGSINCKSLGLNSERHKKLHTFKCSAGRWMAKDLHVMQFPTLRELRLLDIMEIEEMEAINQWLGFLKDSLQTFVCTFSGEGVSKKLKFAIEKLMGSQSLHRLDLRGRLVNDLTIQFPSNLVRLELVGSEIGEGVDLMGVLGHLSKLKHLELWNQAYLGTQLHCTGASFPQLEQLKLGNLDSLEEWRVEGGAMNRLNTLYIAGCYKLKGLPQGIGSISSLEKLVIQYMPKEFCRRLGVEGDDNEGYVLTEEGEDSHIIQHIPTIKGSRII